MDHTLGHKFLLFILYLTIIETFLRKRFSSGSSGSRRVECSSRRPKVEGSSRATTAHTYAELLLEKTV
jgi:hypothetical protein